MDSWMRVSMANCCFVGGDSLLPEQNRKQGFWEGKGTNDFAAHRKLTILFFLPSFLPLSSTSFLPCFPHSLSTFHSRSSVHRSSSTSLLPPSFFLLPPSQLPPLSLLFFPDRAYLGHANVNPTLQRPRHGSQTILDQPRQGRQ